MEKVRIVFFSYGKKETVIVPQNKYFDRLLGRCDFKDNGITIFNSQIVEVFRQDYHDRRKWYLWRKYTCETFPIPD